MNDIVFKFVQGNIKEQFLKQLQDSFETYFNYPFNREYYEDYFLSQLKKRKVQAQEPVPAKLEMNFEYTPEPPITVINFANYANFLK